MFYIPIDMKGFNVNNFKEVYINPTGTEVVYRVSDYIARDLTNHQYYIRGLLLNKNFNFMRTLANTLLQYDELSIYFF